MIHRLQLPAAFLAAALALPGCKGGFDADYEAEVSLYRGSGASLPPEETVAEELRARAGILPIEAEIDAGTPGDGRLTILLKAAGKEEALAALDSLCHSGELSVRAVHDRTAYLSTAARDDPDLMPAGYEILTFTLRAGDKTRVEDLVISTEDLLTGADVKSARAERYEDGTVHISLTPSGGERLAAATKSMQKGRSRLAIIYDGSMISAPVVIHELSSEFSLEGFNSFEEARSVAAALHAPLSTKLLIESLKPLAPQGAKP